MTANIGNLSCDNYDLCGNTFPEQGSVGDTLARARVRGWHVFQGRTYGFMLVNWYLCPECVGKRARLPKAPAVLPGQEELF